VPLAIVRGGERIATEVPDVLGGIVAEMLKDYCAQNGA
jgi:hypothetical protein